MRFSSRKAQQVLAQDRGDNGLPVSREAGKRAPLILLATFLLLLAMAALGSTLDADPYRSASIDFNAMAAGNVLVLTDLAESAAANAKLHWALEGSEPPDVGMYGYHTVRYFGADADPGQSIFNYYFEHISLIEVRDLLRLQAAAGALPRKEILVQLSHPAIGPHLTARYNGALPTWFLARAIVGGSPKIRDVAALVGARVSGALDWKAILYASFVAVAKCQNKYGIADVSQPSAAGSYTAVQFTQYPWLAALTGALAAKLNSFCADRRLIGWSGDGSSYPRLAPVDDVAAPAFAALDRWSPHDIAAEEDLVLEIAGIAERAGARAVFFVPPQRGTFIDRGGNRLYDRMLSDLPVCVLDYRRNWESEWMVNAGHPGTEFYRVLMADADNRCSGR